MEEGAGKCMANCREANRREIGLRQHDLVDTMLEIGDPGHLTRQLPVKDEPISVRSTGYGSVAGANVYCFRRTTSTVVG